MSQSVWTSRPEPPAQLRPEIWVGAANPLWGFFFGAALVGMAGWLASRWLPTDFPPVRAGRAIAPIIPVGGEAAPVSPLLEGDLDQVIDAEFTPVARSRKSRGEDPKPH